MMTTTTNPRDLAYALGQHTDGEVRGEAEGVWLDDRAARELIDNREDVEEWKANYRDADAAYEEERKDHRATLARVETLEELLGKVLDELDDGDSASMLENLELVRDITLTIGR